MVIFAHLVAYPSAHVHGFENFNWFFDYIKNVCVGVGGYTYKYQTPR